MDSGRKGRPARGMTLALLAGGLAWPLAATLPAFAQAPAARMAAPQAVAVQPGEEQLSQPQLEQLLAPVALFPDTLLMQVLIAATYPIEIVQAERWLRQGRNAELQGEALARVLESQPWDASVKSLVPFPDLLKMMSEQLEWTQQLGDALLAQQEDVLNAIQVLRGRAQAAGQLQSGPQQVVQVTQNVNVTPTAGTVVAPPPQIITIAPANPERVYVPVYNPNVVFGTWPHTAYPPVFFPPPPGWGMANALLTGLAFATGVAVVGSLWGWSSPGWGRGTVIVNPTRVNNININRTQITNTQWRHDATHRHGVAYNNTRVRNDFAGRDRAAADARRDQLRGRAQDLQRPGGGDRPGLGERPGGGDRPNLGQRPGGGDRPNLGERPGGGDRPNLGERPGGGDRPNLGNRPGGGDRPNLGERPGGGDRPNLGNHPGSGDRPTLGERPGGGQLPAQRPGGGQVVQRPEAQRPNIQRPAQAPSGRPNIPQQRPTQAPAFQDIGGRGGDARAAAQRGAASRAAAPQPRPQAQRPQGGEGPRGGGGLRGGRH